jgi:aspartyl protease family protein
MATGFMMRHFICLSLLVVSAAAAPVAAAAEVSLIGVIGDKAAVIVLDGGEPKTVKVGQSWRGVTVLAVERDRATVEIDGKKRVLERGLHYRSTAAVSSDRGKAILAADSRGHFLADASVNGLPVRFVVDTGATLIALPQRDAERLGIDYRAGQVGQTRTANGVAQVYLVKLDSVRLGGIELHNVDATVHLGGGLDQPLLGMSFLNRVQMQRDGGTMTLIQRF